MRKKGKTLKYVYTMEIGPKGSRHIHAVINDTDLAELQESWDGVVNIQPLFSDGNYEKIAQYFVKYSVKTEETEAKEAEETKTGDQAGQEETAGTGEEKTSETDEAEQEEEKTSGAEADAAEDKKEDKEEEQKSDKADKKDQQIADLKDRLVRQMAEFDNYRKRTEKEKTQNYEIGASDFILKLLPVIDNFERGLAAVAKEDKDTSFVQGIEMIYKQLIKLLDDEGVKEIEALGKEFDPAFHNAVMQQESEEYDSGVVMQVLQKGYMYKDRVLRHSMVMVAK